MTSAESELWARLYDEALPRVQRTIRAIVHDQEDAEDLAHEAFEYAMRAWCQLPDKSRPVSWLLLIARHRAISHLRRRRRQLELPRRLYEPRAAGGLEDQVDDQSLLAALVRTLSSEERTALKLRYVDELGQGEAARRLGVPQGTVARRTHVALVRARARLPMAGMQALSRGPASSRTVGVAGPQAARRAAR